MATPSLVEDYIIAQQYKDRAEETEAERRERLIRKAIKEDKYDPYPNIGYGQKYRNLSEKLKDTIQGPFDWDTMNLYRPPRYTVSNELDVNWETPWGKKTEQPQQQQSFFTKLLARLQNIKDPEKRRSWFKRLMGNLLRMNPATGPAMGIYDLAKAIKQGGGQGILGALGQKGMQKIFGKNLDVARGIFGAASGQMTPGQALGGVAMGRGMKTGMNNLMKNIYKKYGMSGVKTAMPIMKTLMQGQGPGKG